MSHWHLQIQFGFDFEGYAAGFIQSPPPSSKQVEMGTAATLG